MGRAREQHIEEPKIQVWLDGAVNNVAGKEAGRVVRTQTREDPASLVRL